LKKRSTASRIEARAGTKETVMTTRTLTHRPSTRLDDIAQRALRSRLRQRLFIAAVAIITVVTIGTVAFGATPGL
jgi:hypothetical protein